MAIVYICVASLRIPVHMIRKIWVCTLDVIMCDFELDQDILTCYFSYLGSSLNFSTQQREVRSDSSTNVNFTG